MHLAEKAHIRNSKGKPVLLHGTCEMGPLCLGTISDVPELSAILKKHMVKLKRAWDIEVSSLGCAQSLAFLCLHKGFVMKVNQVPAAWYSAFKGVVLCTEIIPVQRHWLCLALTIFPSWIYKTPKQGACIPRFCVVTQTWSYSGKIFAISGGHGRKRTKSGIKGNCGLEWDLVMLL